MHTKTILNSKHSNCKTKINLNVDMIIFLFLVFTNFNGKQSAI